MSHYIPDGWLPEVVAEYRALAKAPRDVGADVGNQFCAFERIVERGLDSDWRPIEQIGSADLYAMYGRHALMFFAVSGGRIAAVKWARFGTPRQQSLARQEAMERAGRQYA